MAHEQDTRGKVSALLVDEDPISSASFLRDMAEVTEPLLTVDIEVSTPDDAFGKLQARAEKKTPYDVVIVNPDVKGNRTSIEITHDGLKKHFVRFAIVWSNNPNRRERAASAIEHGTHNVYDKGRLESTEKLIHQLNRLKHPQQEQISPRT